MESIINGETKERTTDCAGEALRLFPQMLFSIDDPLKNFKRGQYGPVFKEYQDQHREIMDLIEDAFLGSEDREGFLKDLAGELVSQAQKTLSGQKKRRQEEMLSNYNMSIVIYLNPALIEYNKSSGRPVAEEILRKWKECFPRTNLKISDFESINSGFKTKFCYITTAVCESLKKPDDCYELNLLRDYRDTYLLGLPGGEKLIEAYYDVSPTIVKHINRHTMRDAIYADIWREYLSPCIRLIEEHKNEQCRVLYQDMVDTLARRYFKQEGHIS